MHGHIFKWFVSDFAANFKWICAIHEKIDLEKGLS